MKENRRSRFKTEGHPKGTSHGASALLVPVHSWQLLSGGGIKDYKRHDFGRSNTILGAALRAGAASAAPPEKRRQPGVRLQRLTNVPAGDDKKQTERKTAASNLKPPVAFAAEMAAATQRAVMIGLMALSLKRAGVPKWEGSFRGGKQFDSTAY